jgi:hypothetical protein
VDPAGTQSDASAETIDYRPPPDRHRFFLRLSVGAGMGLISDESQLIDYSQYGQLFRMWGFIDFGWIPLPHVGIGAWEAATGRATGNALFPNGAPHFYELDTMTGTSLFAFDELKTSRDPITIYAAFRTGVAFGHAGIGTLERIGTAPAWERKSASASGGSVFRSVSFPPLCKCPLSSDNATISGEHTFC